MTFDERLSVAIQELQPVLGLHQGGLSLVRADEGSGRVEVHFEGACSSCALSSITLKQGVERFLASRVPGVTSVVAV